MEDEISVTALQQTPENLKTHMNERTFQILLSFNNKVNLLVLVLVTFIL